MKSLKPSFVHSAGGQVLNTIWTREVTNPPLIKFERIFYALHNRQSRIARYSLRNEIIIQSLLFKNTKNYQIFSSHDTSYIFYLQDMFEAWLMKWINDLLNNKIEMLLCWFVETILMIWHKRFFSIVSKTEHSVNWCKDMCLL